MIFWACNVGRSSGEAGRQSSCSRGQLIGPDWLGRLGGRPTLHLLCRLLPSIARASASASTAIATFVYVGSEWVGDGDTTRALGSVLAWFLPKRSRRSSRLPLCTVARQTARPSMVPRLVRASFKIMSVERGNTAALWHVRECLARNRLERR